jgi:hypothetical protein
LCRFATKRLGIERLHALIDFIRWSIFCS